MIRVMPLDAENENSAQHIRADTDIYIQISVL